jgi:hypothetical protein
MRTGLDRVVDILLGYWRGIEPADAQSRRAVWELSRRMSELGIVEEWKQVSPEAGSELLQSLITQDDVLRQIVSFMGGPSGAECQDLLPDPVRLLFLGASPLGHARVRWDVEVRSLKDKLSRRAAIRKIKLRVGHAATRNELVSGLLQFEPHILHFSGHGESGRIILETDDGRPYEVTCEGLVDLLVPFRNNLRVIVLNACYTGQEVEILRSNGFAVIAAARAIFDEMAIEFSMRFYESLSVGRSLRDSFEVACGALSISRWPKEDRPTLLVPCLR